MNQGVFSDGGWAVICTPFCGSFVTSIGSFGRIGREGAAVGIGAGDLRARR